MRSYGHSLVPKREVQVQKLPILASLLPTALRKWGGAHQTSNPSLSLTSKHSSHLTEPSKGGR